MSDKITIAEGVVDAVFAHRFVLKRADGTRLLADLGPKGLDAFPLVEGATVAIEGEAKPSETKVTRITPKGGASVAIVHGRSRDGIEPAEVLASVQRAGLDPVGEPRRKPKHFEVLARRGGNLFEVHVETDGAIRKEKPADREKWSDEIAVAA